MKERRLGPFGAWWDRCGCKGLTLYIGPRELSVGIACQVKIREKTWKRRIDLATDGSMTGRVRLGRFVVQLLWQDEGGADDGV